MLTFKTEVWVGIVSVVIVLGLLGLVVTKQVWINKFNPFQLTSALTSSKNKPISVIELAKHNLPTDCWVAVQGKVYNLTSFAATHSGGSEMILQSCGTDATDIFATRYGEGPHPAGALAVIAPLQVGQLSQ